MSPFILPTSCVLVLLYVNVKLPPTNAVLVIPTPVLPVAPVSPFTFPTSTVLKLSFNVKYTI